MVRFDPILQSYSYKGRSYVRASSLYSYFKEPFDPIAQSIKYAKKHGETPEYWRKEWETKTVKACNRGHKFHDYKEAITKNTKQYQYWGDSIQYGGEKEDPDYYNTWPDGVYTEVKLWHHGFRIAGRCDVVILETIDGVRYMHLDDYKTSGVIKTRGFTYPGSNVYATMLHPISYLEDCNAVHFQLQLSTYQLCGEFLGFRPGNRRILHYPQTAYARLMEVEEFEEIPTIYDLPYLKKEVISMANHYNASTGKR